MRAASLAVTAAAAVLIGVAPARADGRCDLNTVVGYFLLFGKPIEGYVQNGAREKGYTGCAPDRVLVFSDNTGVRCKGLARQNVSSLPTGYLFVRQNESEMMLCVEGELFPVTQTN